jgi:hypothetical protein
VGEEEWRWGGCAGERVEVVGCGYILMRHVRKFPSLSELTGWTPGPGTSSPLTCIEHVGYLQKKTLVGSFVYTAPLLVSQ